MLGTNGVSLNQSLNLNNLEPRNGISIDDKHGYYLTIFLTLPSATTAVKRNPKPTTKNKVNILMFTRQHENFGSSKFFVETGDMTFLPS